MNINSSKYFEKKKKSSMGLQRMKSMNKQK